ncbi:MAG: hypothetical protein IMW86_04230 [Hydrogenibacillus sp.]|nr:hypothetical protein [Hydrogenibacillus sp.]
MRKKESVVSQEEIIERVLGDTVDPFTTVVRAHIQSAWRQRVARGGVGGVHVRARGADHGGHPKFARQRHSLQPTDRAGASK